MFGLWNEAPETGMAWGARTIYRYGETFDIVWDRQDFRDGSGDRKGFLDHLNKVALPVARERAKSMDPRTSETVTLFEEDGLVVKGDTRGSCGYLYLIAYRTDSPEPLEGAIWTGAMEVPAVGSLVVPKGDIGECRVLGFFKSHEYLGVYALPVNPPDWFVRQNGPSACNFFGAELQDVALDRDVSSISAFPNFGALEKSCREHGYVPTLRLSEDHPPEFNDSVQRVRTALEKRGYRIYPPTPA